MENLIATNNPKVSILMTLFNREKFIASAIESVQESKYTNFELIIVDDCSSDNSVEIARKYESTDSRITVYANKRNLGQFQNRNKAAEYASGEYIKYLDSDDIIYPHGLQVMVWAIDRFPSAAFAISHPKPEEKTPYPILLTPVEAYMEQFLGSGVMDSGPSAIIFNRKLFIESGGFKEDGYVGNDTEILYRIAKKHPIIKMPTALVWWRQHEGQAINAGHISNEYILNHFRLIMDTLKSPECPLTNPELTRAIKRQKQHHARKILALAISLKKPGLAWRVYKESKLSFGELLKGFRAYQ